MKDGLKLFGCALTVALFSMFAAAQDQNCGKAIPQGCERLQNSKNSCKDKVAADKQKCVLNAMLAVDCSKVRNAQRCETMQKARNACKSKIGADYQQCLGEYAPIRDTGGPAPRPG